MANIRDYFVTAIKSLLNLTIHFCFLLPILLPLSTEKGVPYCKRAEIIPCEPDADNAAVGKTDKGFSLLLRVIMKTDTMYRYPVALTIAGSDSGGGAGIQADIKTFSALGVYGASVITSVTAQNTQGVRGIQAISPEILKGQLDAVFEDITIDAVKIGMLHNKTAAEIVVNTIDTYSPSYIVLDPVMISTSGNKLLQDDAIDIIVRELFKRTTLVTPNIDEAEFLSEMKITSEKEMGQAADKLLAMGCRAVLMKGGHLKGDKMTDILYTEDRPPLRLSAETIETANGHGTGCTLSSAIAAYLALGNNLPQAVKSAKDYITKAILAGKDVRTGHGHGPLNHFFSPVPLIKLEMKE